MKTEGLFLVLYFFHACENTERIVSIITLMNQCSSSNHATKHFFLFLPPIFFLFSRRLIPSLSPSSPNFRFLVLLLQLFQIGIRLLHVKTIPFLSLYLPNFKFLFFWNQICKSFTYFGSPSIRDTHLIRKSASISHLFKLSNFCFFNYTRILRNTSSVSIETHVRNNTKSIF